MFNNGRNLSIFAHFAFSLVLLHNAQNKTNVANNSAAHIHPQYVMYACVLWLCNILVTLCHANGGIVVGYKWWHCGHGDIVDMVALWRRWHCDSSGIVSYTRQTLCRLHARTLYNLLNDFVRGMRQDGARLSYTLPCINGIGTQCTCLHESRYTDDMFAIDFVRLQ